MILLSNESDTAALAEVIGQAAQPGDNLVLTGELGAGKTTLTKGIAIGLGITKLIKSPTYTIIREYPKGRIPLYHMDIYRIESGAGDLGLDEYFEGDGLSVIEWGNLLEEYLPEDYLELILTKDAEHAAQRRVELKAFGANGTAFANRILTAWAKR